MGENQYGIYCLACKSFQKYYRYPRREITEMTDETKEARIILRENPGNFYITTDDFAGEKYVLRHVYGVKEEKGVTRFRTAERRFLCRARSYFIATILPSVWLRHSSVTEDKDE
jgi:hypothetical protein